MLSQWVGEMLTPLGSHDFSTTTLNRAPNPGTCASRYHFVTTTCAIIGGVFTVAGIVDGLVHTGARLAKKVELGKHT